MSIRRKQYNVLHICDYAAQYRGNFIDSLEAIEDYHDNIKNFFLFPQRANNTKTKEWIDAMNEGGTVAYIQHKRFWKNVFLFIQIIREHKIDRIVRHFSDFRMDILIKFLFGNKKTIRFFHCGYRPQRGFLGEVKHRLRKFIWKDSKLVGVSDAVAREIKEKLPDFHVTSIVNAIHFERLHKKEAFSKQEGIRLLMMGWDHRRKGVDLAIKATDHLRRKYNLILQIVCGKNEDEVRDLAKRILGKDTDWICFLPQTNNIGTYYSASDIFLSPSRQEAFGYANIEAAYCKNNIVLSKVDGQGELQIEGAYWFESENIADFENKLEKAILDLSDPEKAMQKEKTKRQIEQIYSLEEWTGKLVDLF